ncbi:MAG: oxidoreductase, partial [Desulfamplus sp.]|nr:oxidoreductase [Desulfamplus sp.]
MKKIYSPEEIDKCIAMLEDMAEQTEIIANIPESQRIALLSAAGRVSRPDRKYLKQRRKEMNKIQRQPIVEQERRARAATGIRSSRDVEIFEAPEQITAVPSSFEQALNSP